MSEKKLKDLPQEVDEEGHVEVSKSESKNISIWKVSLVKPVQMGKHVVELTAKVDNLFTFSDESYVNPGRQYMFGLRYVFN